MFGEKIMVGLFDMAKKIFKSNKEDTNELFFNGHIVDRDGFLNGDLNIDVYNEYRQKSEEGMLSYKKCDNPEITFTSPENIHEIRLSNEDVENEANFWGQHGREAKDYEALAENIPEVMQRMKTGEPIESISKDPQIGATARLYFHPDNMVKVYEYKGTYIFDSDGRHRVLAAQRMGVDLPVKVIGRYSPNEIEKTTVESKPWELTPDEKVDVEKRTRKLQEEWAKENSNGSNLDGMKVERPKEMKSWELMPEEKEDVEQRTRKVLENWKKEHSDSSKKRPEDGYERERVRYPEDPRWGESDDVSKSSEKKDLNDALNPEEKEEIEKKKDEKVKNPFAYTYKGETRIIPESAQKTDGAKQLRRNPTEQWKIGMNAIDQRMEIIRDDLRDKGMSDGSEMERIIGIERKKPWKNCELILKNNILIRSQNMRRQMTQKLTKKIPLRRKKLWR